MKKKGFTLIELLAVIVILAIIALIALIATPIVMNIIENSRKGAAERTAENYLDAVEIAIASERLDGLVTDGEYKIQGDGSLCIFENGKVDCDKSELNVEVNGEKPSAGGTILIENGQVVDKLSGDTPKKTTMTIRNYTASYNEDGKLEAVKNEEKETETLTVYRWSEESVNIGSELSSFTYVENPSDLEYDYYLKHTIENNIVTESYVCAKLNGVDQETCIRGGSPDYFGYASDAANFTGNAAILNSLGDIASCDCSSSFFVCFGDPVDFGAQSSGRVNAYIYDEGGCSVNDDGSSSCNSH